MTLLISDTFTASLARLTPDEQKSAKLTVFELQTNPANPGLEMHRVDKSKDRDFWSARVSRDLRIIVHRRGDDMLLCYADHHDDAYDWARRRKLETHPSTGAAQLVEVRERVREIEVPKYVEVERPAPVRLPLFARHSDAELLSYGVPTEWLGDVREVADQDGVVALIDHLPGEAIEALMDLAIGRVPVVPVAVDGNPFAHPDAKRRFRIVENVEELERALDAPWEKWTIFLHPAQRALVERDFSGPARVAGSAGTGKTIVALHRAVHLARKDPEARVLLTTFSDALANALRERLHRLIGNAPRIAERLEVRSVSAVAGRLLAGTLDAPRLASEATIREALRVAMREVPENAYGEAFVESEWRNVVDAWSLRTWEAYRVVPRLGRKRQLPEKQRAALWEVFRRAWASLDAAVVVTEAGMFTFLANALVKRGRPPFDFVVVDEAQDVSVAQLRFFAALGSGRTNGLFFTGDLGQRIFQQPFSWKALGVDVRGRSMTLRVNYRTSHQIRSMADRLMVDEIVDVDGNAESRTGTISTFDGASPVLRTFEDAETESAAVAGWLTECVTLGVLPHEIGVFVRSGAQIGRAEAALRSAGLRAVVLDERLRTQAGAASIGTMHLAKGLEFRAVAVMACDDDVLPLADRVAAVDDAADLKEVFDTERQLLYVACTRARDFLLVTGVAPGSAYLADLSGEP